MNTKTLETEVKKINGLDTLTIQEVGDDHLYTGLKTPMKPTAFLISDQKKKEKIAKLFGKIMDVMGLDLTDDSLKGTPERVAKMYIDEIFSGLNPNNKPKIALFDNIYQYNQMLVEKNITFYSNCEHHFVPIIGKAHIAYISSGKVIGLSKLNRIVQYYAKRPQVQERLTIQIVKERAQKFQVVCKETPCILDQKKCSENFQRQTCKHVRNITVIVDSHTNY